MKGECKRGEECPYRHDKPTDPDDPLADQNIKDRYPDPLYLKNPRVLSRICLINIMFYFSLL